MKNKAIIDFSVDYLSHDKLHQTDADSHHQGQLFFLESGMISCQAKDKYWTITPNCIGWIPAQTQHRTTCWGKIAGWRVNLPASCDRLLPTQARLLQNNPLISALLTRIISFVETNTLTDAQSRLFSVFIDEISQSKPITSLLLPLPTDLCLIKITQAILTDPTNKLSQVEWASWVGISVRSLSRHFMAETGMTFTDWKQLARIMLSLEKLSQNLSINEIAYAVGFSDASAYIASFKAIMGISPKRYFETEL
ncbi:helix-turn-helix transcriptional regulator [Utexia brackfieldae]|uniref:AraC family transcriptional regulator n=1 Tax=Utexia brackfieldae TaxID=3074108 RepID=UPI00370D1875